MGKSSTSPGSCTALNPTDTWPYESGLTNATGCASLNDDPLGCRAKPECTWELTTGRTPDDYDAQITSLGQQYSVYLEQRALDCSRFRAMGADKDTCDTAKMHIADIDSTFTNMANDLSSDITGVEKKISSVDVQINKLELENAKLTKKLSSALNLDAGAQGQITDVQLLYNQDLVANWILGLSMVGFVVILLLTRDVSAEAVKTQTRALAQQASRTFPGVTSMIPGM
jgi:hypothetical protein